MKYCNTLLTLAGWNWRIFKKEFFLCAAILFGCETAVLCALALPRQSFGFGFDALFNGGRCLLLFALAYLCVLVISQKPLAILNGKSKAGYTVQLLPLPRGSFLLAQILSSATALLALIAMQIAACFLLYWPVTLLQGIAGRGIAEGQPTVTGGFYTALARNTLLRFLLPSSWLGALVLLLCVAAPAVMMAAAFVQCGKRRVAAIVAGLAAAFCCVVCIICIYSDETYILPFLVAALFLLMLLSYLAAAQSLRTAQTLS